MSTLSHRPRRLAPLGKSDRRRAYLSLAMLAALAAAAVIVAPSSAVAGSAFDLDAMRYSAPIALMSVAGLVVFYCGVLDMSLAGLFVLALVVLGEGTEVTDLGIFLVALGVACAGILAGSVMAWTHYAEVAGIVLFFVYRGAAVFVAGYGNVVSDVEQSFVMRGLRASLFGVGVPLVVLVVIVVAVSLLMERTPLGRRIRATGVDQDRAARVGIRTFRTRAWAYLCAGTLVVVAALVALARVGAASPQSSDRILLGGLVGMVVGNGGLRRGTPAPVRVAATALTFGALEQNLSLRGWNADGVGVLAGGLLVFTIVGDRLIEARTPKAGAT